MTATQPKTPHPTDISEDVYLPILGHMAEKPRKLFMMIVDRSRRGLWTSYDDCLDAGMVAPSAGMRDVLSACRRAGVFPVSFTYKGRRASFCVCGDGHV